MIELYELKLDFIFPSEQKFRQKSLISLSFFLKPDILVYSKYTAIFSVAQYHFFLLYINGDFSDTKEGKKNVNRMVYSQDCMY